MYASQYGGAVVAIRLSERVKVGFPDVEWLVDVMRVEHGWGGDKVIVTQTVFPDFALYNMCRSPP